MHRIIVEERRWISETRFLHALNYCMLLPGPEGQQLAIYIGWLMHKTLGGVIVGGLFVLPGLIAIMALSIVYAVFGHVGVVVALFFGLKAAVLAIVIQAVMRVGKRALKNKVLISLAVIAFTAIFFFFFFIVQFPVIVFAAGLIGFIGTRLGREEFAGRGNGNEALSDNSLLGDEMPPHARASAASLLRVAASWLALWLVPVAVLNTF